MKKSWSREVAGFFLAFETVIISWVIFFASPERIKAVEGIVMGWAAPVFFACMGAFVVKSVNDHMDKRVDAARKL